MENKPNCELEVATSALASAQRMISRFVGRSRHSVRSLCGNVRGGCASPAGVALGVASIARGALAVELAAPYRKWSVPVTVRVPSLTETRTV